MCVCVCVCVCVCALYSLESTVRGSFLYSGPTCCLHVVNEVFNSITLYTLQTDFSFKEWLMMETRIYQNFLYLSQIILWFGKIFLPNSFFFSVMSIHVHVGGDGYVMQTKLCFV